MVRTISKMLTQVVSAKHTYTLQNCFLHFLLILNITITMFHLVHLKSYQKIILKFEYLIENFE